MAEHVPTYIRASKKQLAFIASLCDQLGFINKTLYQRTSMEEATKIINRLKRKLEKQRQQDRQLKLL